MTLDTFAACEARLRGWSERISKGDRVAMAFLEEADVWGSVAELMAHLVDSGCMGRHKHAAQTAVRSLPALRRAAAAKYKKHDTYVELRGEDYLEAARELRDFRVGLAQKWRLAAGSSKWGRVTDKIVDAEIQLTNRAESVGVASQLFGVYSTALDTLIALAGHGALWTREGAGVDAGGDAGGDAGADGDAADYICDKLARLATSGPARHGASRKRAALAEKRLKPAAPPRARGRPPTESELEVEEGRRYVYACESYARVLDALAAESSRCLAAAPESVLTLAARGWAAWLEGAASEARDHAQVARLAVRNAEADLAASTAASFLPARAAKAPKAAPRGGRPAT